MNYTSTTGDITSMIHETFCEDDDNMKFLIALGVFFISEIMPFLKCSSNGLCHAIMGKAKQFKNAHVEK